MGGADGMKTVKADMPPDLMTQCRVLMNTPVSRNDLAALQAMKTISGPRRRRGHS